MDKIGKYSLKILKNKKTVKRLSFISLIIFKSLYYKTIQKKKKSQILKCLKIFNIE